MSYTFSKKQAGIVYKAWKNGKIEADKSIINLMYLYTENDFWCNSREDFVARNALNKMISCIFLEYYGCAQKAMNSFANFLPIAYEKYISHKEEIARLRQLNDQFACRAN